MNKLQIRDCAVSHADIFISNIWEHVQNFNNQLIKEKNYKLKKNEYISLLSEKIDNLFTDWYEHFSQFDGFSYMAKEFNDLQNKVKYDVWVLYDGYLYKQVSKLIKKYSIYSDGYKAYKELTIEHK